MIIESEGMSNMYYFEYEISLYDTDVDTQESMYYGVTCCNSLQEAIANIEDFYGKEEIISVKLVPWDASICLDMSKEALNLIKKEI